MIPRREKGHGRIGTAKRVTSHCEMNGFLGCKTSKSRAAYKAVNVFGQWQSVCRENDKEERAVERLSSYQGGKTFEDESSKVLSE